MNVNVQKTVWSTAVWVGMAICLLGKPGAGWSGEPRLLNAIEKEIVSIIENNRSGVVRIHTLHIRPEGDDGQPFGTGFTHGTGFIFDSDGHILTVEGAVQGAEVIRVTLASGLETKATFVASDPVSEVAVIRVDLDSLTSVTFGNSDRVRVGHYAFILGNTFGNLNHSFGSVHEINPDQELIQVAAAVNPSYGGAPVFCSTGEAVGMVWAALDPAAALRQTQTPDGFPGSIAGWHELPTTVFVIPMNRVVSIARKLIADGEMAYGGLGVVVEEDKGGVRVIWVESQGPAWYSGLQTGDLILSYQGRSVAGPHHLRRLVMESAPGSPVLLGIRRQEKPVTTRVTVGRISREALADAGQPVLDEQVVLKQIAGPEQELGGVRQLLQTGSSGDGDLWASPGRPDRNREALFQQIHNVEQELGRLRQLLKK